MKRFFESGINFRLNGILLKNMARKSDDESLDFDAMYKERQKLLSAKNLDEFVKLYIKSTLNGSTKGYLAKLWAQSNGRNPKEIETAKNKHPLWKEYRKEKYGHLAKERNARHDYREPGTRQKWDYEKLKKFYTKNAAGTRDIELAQEFKTTFPVVYHLRRKINMAVKILNLEKSPVTAAKVCALATTTESKLRDDLKQRTGKGGKSKAKAAPSSKK